MHRISLVRWTGLYRRAYADYRRETFSPEGIRPVEVLMGAAVMLPREVFQACGGWDERYRFGGEDLDLSTQVGRIRPLVYVGTIEVVHLGRVASRKNVGFAAPNVAIGYVHYFRKSGAHARQLLVYKLLVTLDAPLQLLGKLSQGLVRQLRGDRGKAGKSWESARGASQFLCRELVRFWKA
jgi:GT2 family glycosyltransferase